MTIYFQVTATELLAAGAPLTAIRQSYRKYAGFTEKVVATKATHPLETGSGTAEAVDAKVVYESTGTSKDGTVYFVPAMSKGKPVEAVGAEDTKTLVWGGSIKDSYVEVTATE